MARFEVFVNEEFCKGCSLCIHFCSKDAIKLSDKFNAAGVNVPVSADMEECSGCRLCELYCPAFAIAIRESADRK